MPPFLASGLAAGSPPAPGRPAHAGPLDADSSGPGGHPALDPAQSEPLSLLRAIPTLGPFGKSGIGAALLLRLEDGSGTLQAGRTGVRFTLTLDGSAVFGDSATQGILIQGGGTNRALVEFVAGFVALPILDPSTELVTLAGLDSEGVGIQLLAQSLNDFERSDGAFTHSGTKDAWEYGVPTTGPRQAYSGAHVWATGLARNYPNSSDSLLATPFFSLPAGTRPRLEFQSWLQTEICCDRAYVEARTSNQTGWHTLATAPETAGGYLLQSLDLSPMAGTSAQFRFRLTSDAITSYPGWYIDDFSIAGLPATVDFLDPGGNIDGDDLTNGQEIDAATDPRDPDTDKDGSPDGPDNCPLAPNPDQADLVHPNSFGDACEDPDHDGVHDLADNCPDAYNPSQLDGDRDRRPNACDNCPSIYNPDQRDTDQDGAGDVCPRDSGTAGDPHPPFSLPFVPTNVVFDPSRPYLYASDKAARKIYFVNLQTGLTERQFSFAHMPESLAISRDGSTLFATLLVREHRTWPFNASPFAFISRFNLDAWHREMEYQIPVDPLDLVPTGDGHLVVSCGSNSSFNVVKVFDSLTGAVTSKPDSSQSPVMRLALHPSERMVYAATSIGLAPSDLVRFDLLPGGDIFLRWDSTYHGDHRIEWDVWASPRGDVLATLGGDIFQVGVNRATDIVYAASLPTEYLADLVFDDQHNVIFTAEESGLHYYNRASYFEIGSQSIAGGIRFVGFRGDTVYGIQLSGTQSILQTFPHPALGGDVNTPPEARFAVSPGDGTTRTDFRFDASESRDAQDSISSLRFRWDFDDDGRWDTPFSAEPVVAKRFDAPGSYRARLQVIDNLALVDDIIHTVDVSFEVDPGEPGISHPPFELPFAATDLVFDPVRPVVYVADGPGGRICFVNLLTGRIERQFAFDLFPQSIAVTPDGAKLFAALMIPPPGGGGPPGTVPEGIVAGFDLRDRTKVTQFKLPVTPHQLVASPDGHVVISPETGQHTSLSVFDGATGRLSGTGAYAFQKRFLALHPSGTIVYATEHQSTSQNRITRYDLRPDGSIAFGWDSPYLGNRRIRAGVWASPRGDALVSRGGDVFSAGGPRAGEDMLFLTSLSVGSIDALAFDMPRKVILTVEGPVLHYYNIQSFFEIGRQAIPWTPAFLGTAADQVFAIRVEEESTKIHPLPHPAPGGAFESLPEARIVLDPPTIGTTQTRFRFDASLTADAQDPLSSLQFRWDLDGNGSWDTPFAGDPVVVKRFLSEGIKTVRLQAKDTFGNTDVASVSVQVEFAPDPGDPGRPHPAFDLPIVATDALFDPVRPYVYVADGSAHRISFVNLGTGMIDKEFAFDYPPEALAITPDASRLYATLPLQAHDRYGIMSEFGFLAAFDLRTGIKDHQFRIAADPFDILATGDGRLVISKGTGQWTTLDVLRAPTGELLYSNSGAYPVYQGSRLALHPSEQTVYAATTNLSPPHIDRLDLSATALTYRWPSGYFNLHRFGDDLWVSPRGNILVTQGGDIFSAGGADRATDMIFLRGLSAGSIADLAWDLSHGEIVTMEGDGVHRYGIDDFHPLETIPLGGGGKFVARRADRIHALLGHEGRTILKRLVPDNRPPTADAGDDQVVECTGLLRADVELYGGNSSDPDSSPGTNDDIESLAWYEVSADGSRKSLGPGASLRLSLGLGIHRLVLRVTDRSGREAEDEVTARVIDSAPPQLQVRSGPSVLWPPNHELTPVYTTVASADACDPRPVVRLLRVSSSEPDDSPGGGDGETLHDIQNQEIGTLDLDIRLRSERDGRATGRTYVLTYASLDAAGNEGYADTMIHVPHDMKGVTEPLVARFRTSESGNHLEWGEVPGAMSYTVVRGNTRNLWDSGPAIDLGPLTCIAREITVGTPLRGEDAEIPPLGEVFFYLVSCDHGGAGSYGTESTAKPRRASQGGCE